MSGPGRVRPWRFRCGTCDPAGGFLITGIALTVRAEVTGLDADAFAAAAQAAKDGCPVSKALTAVPITLDAALL